MLLQLRDLTVRRGPEPVVTGLTVTIRPGRVFWVTGPNGAGKTGLLRVLALLDPPVSGQVLHGTPDDEPVLYFQSEMALPASSTAGAWERLVDALLTSHGRAPASPHTGLWPRVAAGRKVGRLSTGERKRLLLDALLRRQGALLLDEPYEHLSPDGKAALTAALLERVTTGVVVVATNQRPPGVVMDTGLRLEGGVAEPLGQAAGADAGNDR